MSPFVANASNAIFVARTYLNDETSNTWSDPRLMAMLKTAHKMLSAKLVANGMSVTRNQSSIILVPALNIAGGQTGPIQLPNTPSNLLVPIMMLERDKGDDIEDFIEMQQCDFPPDVDPVNELIYWAWQGQQIMLVGATNDNEVQLRYQGFLNVPEKLTDSLGFSFAENYLGPKIASIAYLSLGDNRWRDMDSVAESSLDLVVKYNVIGEQGVPKRRQGYRRGALRRVF